MTDWSDVIYEPPIVTWNGLMLKCVKEDPGPLEFMWYGGSSVKIGGTKQNGDCLIIQTGPLKKYHIGNCNFHGVK